MARRPTGTVVLEQARLDLYAAKTVKQLRVAQAVVFPLDLGIDLARTSELIGMTPGWVARARVRYISLYTIGKKADTRGGRRNNLLTPDEEKEFVRNALLRHRYSWDTLAIGLKEALDKKLHRGVALSTAYNILDRVKRANPEEFKVWGSYDYYLEVRKLIPA